MDIEKNVKQSEKKNHPFLFLIFLCALILTTIYFWNTWQAKMQDMHLKNIARSEDINILLSSSNLSLDSLKEAQSEVVKQVQDIEQEIAQLFSQTNDDVFDLAFPENLLTEANLLNDETPENATQNNTSLKNNDLPQEKKSQAVPDQNNIEQVDQTATSPMSISLNPADLALRDVIVLQGENGKENWRLKASWATLRQTSSLLSMYSPTLLYTPLPTEAADEHTKILTHKNTENYNTSPLTDTTNTNLLEFSKSSENPEQLLTTTETNIINQPLLTTEKPNILSQNTMNPPINLLSLLNQEQGHSYQGENSLLSAMTRQTSLDPTTNITQSLSTTSPFVKTQNINTIKELQQSNLEADINISRDLLINAPTRNDLLVHNFYKDTPNLISITSDRGIIFDNSQIFLKDNVYAKQNTNSIHANALNYNDDTKIATFPTKSIFFGENIEGIAQKLDWHLDSKKIFGSQGVEVIWMPSS